MYSFAPLEYKPTYAFEEKNIFLNVGSQNSSIQLKNDTKSLIRKFSILDHQQFQCLQSSEATSECF